MKYSLLRLVLVLTVSCVAFAILRNGALATVCTGVPMALLFWELIQFGRDLGRPEC